MLFEAPSLEGLELRVLSQIDDLRTQLRSRLSLDEPKRWQGSLRRLSFARAVQGSNSIEGFDAKLDDAAAVIAGEEPLDANEATRLALKGYRDAMTYVLQVAEEPEFTHDEQFLKSLHFMMTNYDLTLRPGRYRAGSSFVHNEETDEIVHEGADVDLVPDLMSELVYTLNLVDDLPVLVRAGMAHLNLVMIHPFRDGNGRMARCVQSLVIARERVLSPVFMSIEEYLGRNTQAYYDVLAEVGGGSWQPGRDARPWVRFVLTAHLRQARTMLNRVRESELLWMELDRLANRYGLPERCVGGLFDASMGLRVRNATYRAFLEGTEDEVTEATASRDLRRMVEVGLMSPRGEKRARFYVAESPIREIRANIMSRRNARDDSDPFAA